MTNYAHTLVVEIKGQYTQLATYNTFDQADKARHSLCEAVEGTSKNKNIFVQITDMNPSLSELEAIFYKVTNKK